MSKKRVKSGAGSAGVQRWEQALLSTPLVEEGKWSCTVGFVAGKQLEDSKHIEVLTSAVNAGTRRLFSIITRDELQAQVIELGNPKSKKPKEIPLNYEVCEPCKDYLDSGEDIPVALLAKLLKFKLLDIKQRDIKRRETEKKSDPGKEKGGKKGAADKKERSKSPGKGGKGGKKTPEPPSAKDGSKLKKRGEEDLDSKYIDDEPDDGTNHYVFVSGFHEPHLIGQLTEIGIDIDAIIKVVSEDYTRFSKQDESSDDLDPAPEKDEKQLAAEEEACKLAAKQTKRLNLFWKDIPLLLQGAAQTSKLQDIARLKYTVPDDIIPQALDDNDARTAFGVVIYEKMACLLYDLLDTKRQWKNFLSNLNLLSVPVFDQTSPIAVQQESQQSAPSMAPSKLEKGAVPEPVPQTEVEVKPTNEVDMRYYNELMNTVPMESTSVPLLMHCMLEQICATDEDKEPPSETPRPLRADGMDDSLAKHIGSMAFKLALSEEEQQILSSEFEPPKKPEPAPKQPTLLSYRDDIGHRLAHLKPVGDFNPKKAELEMMGYLQVSNIQDMPCASPRELKERSARLQELLHFCATGGTTASEVDHAFKQFVFESLKLRTTESDGTVKDDPGVPQTDIAWDHPYPYFVGMIPKPELDDNLDDIALFDRSGAKSPSLSVDGVSPEPAGSQDDRPPSCPPSPGILRRPGSTISKSLSVHSVHFERDDDGNIIEQPGDNDDMIGGYPDDDVDPMDVINDQQRRNLDQWCFAEHLDSSVFLQVLQQSEYTHPYIDTYYHQRDNSMLVVLHNPYADNLQRKEEWTCQLHSNVGFRNYLEHISDSITDWTRDEEAKYQARILAQEVERIHKESEEASSRPASAKDKKRDRSKSPKKSPSRSGKSGSRSSSTERPSSANPFVRDGSLKAWKDDQDRVKAEEEEKDRQKQEKRARSATKKASKEVAADEKEKKRPGSRSSSKTKITKEEPPHADKPEEPREPEPYWPFTGYDLGNQMLHAKGTISSMYPADGGQIRTEKYQFEQGLVGVKSVLLKDGHTFMVHVLDPKSHDEDEMETCVTPLDGSTLQEQEKADLEKSEKEETPRKPDRDEILSKQGTPRTPRTGANTPAEASTTHDMSAVEDTQPSKPCVGAFGSFSAQLCDGMSLALSIYGSSGESVEGKKYEPTAYVAPPPRSLSPTGKDATSPTKSNKKDKKDKSISAATPEPPPQEEEVMVEVKVEEKVPEQPFQQLYLTCPDGLSISYFLESSVGVAPEDPLVGSLLVRQSYPFPTSGIQSTEMSRKGAMEEVSRVASSNGTVVKVLRDGTTQVLFANGTVSQFALSSPLITSSDADSTRRSGSARSERDTTPTRKKDRNRSASRKKEQPVVEEPVEEVTPDPGYWITTTPSGDRVATAMDGTKIPIKQALVCKATDPQTRQVMYTREDHTMIIEHPDGTTIAEHADGTRITTFISEIKIPVESDQSETGEEPIMETKQVKLIQVECPGFATLRFDAETSECSTEFGTGTIVNTFMDGSYDIYHNDGGYLRVEADGTGIYNSRPNNDLEVMDPNQRLQYIMCHFADVVMETVDNQGNLFTVGHQGDCTVMAADDGALLREAEEPMDQEERPFEEEPGKEEYEEEEEEEVDNRRQCKEPETGEQKPCGKHQFEIRTKVIETYKQHAPKFFIVHPDGSGTELLRFQDVSEFIAAAEDDLSTAILMDPLPDYPGVLGITVMKPYTRDVSSRWIRDYNQKSIIPPGLTSRDLTTMPAHEEKQDGPKFGTNVGQGLAVGSLVKAPPQPPVLKCPTALEIRQLLQYKPVSEELRDKLGSGLREYAEYMKSRMLDATALQIQDPRSEEERIQAADLQSQIEGTDMEAADMEAADIQAQLQPDTDNKLDGDIKALYERATACPTPSPPPTPQPKRSQADWDRDERELDKEQECRKALHEHDVPPYFESQLGKAFLLTQLQNNTSRLNDSHISLKQETKTSNLAVESQPEEIDIDLKDPEVEKVAVKLQATFRGLMMRKTKKVSTAPDMEALTKQLADDPRQDETRAVRSGSNSPQSELTRNSCSVPPPDYVFHPSHLSDSSMSTTTPEGHHSVNITMSPTLGPTGNTPSALRPGNPTPAHATGQGSPTSLRPHNPTPAHATKVVPDRPGAPTHDTPSSHVYPSIPEQPQDPVVSEEGVYMDSTQVNIVGEPRKEPVNIPGYISSGRPGAIPNTMFEEIEDPVRRKTYTTSITGATPKGAYILSRMRGFELLPDYVELGTLKEGNTYQMKVFLKNTGVDACRFRVKQPPPSTGMKVIYKPGPVAAGMKAALTIEVYAIAVGVEGDRGVGKISHDLEIVTETDHLMLPITATVLTAIEHDNHNIPRGCKAPGVKWISDRAPGGQAIIRPRKLDKNGKEVRVH